MKQWLMATLLVGFTLNVYASELTPALDTISFQLSAERWVETQSAMLRMTVHATLAHSDIVRVRNNIMEKLQHIAHQLSRRLELSRQHVFDAMLAFQL